jgi:hypothetical protein
MKLLHTLFLLAIALQMSLMVRAQEADDTEIDFSPDADIAEAALQEN